MYIAEGDVKREAIVGEVSVDKMGPLNFLSANPRAHHHFVFLQKKGCDKWKQREDLL
jgi:hypothetical protein